MISLIICSRNKSLLNNIQRNISQTIGINYEVIVQNSPKGEMGIAKAYNLSGAKAKYPYLVFVHEDVQFHSENWGHKVIKHLENEATGLIGVVGTKIKTSAPSGAWLNNSLLDRFFMFQRNPSGDNYIKYANPLNEEISEVKILDGLFLCCRKNVWEENKFDELNFENFHGYDIDFSLQIQQIYKLYVVYDIELEHFSNGGNSKAWIKAMIKITKKWNHALPTYITGIDDILSIEYNALDYYIKALIQNRYYSIHTILIYVKMLHLDIFNLNNLKIIKYFLKNIHKNKI